MRIVWLPTARRQREATIEYIAADNPVAALDQMERIEHSTDPLADHPALGRRGRVTSTRELVIPRTPFIVVYRVRDEAVQILQLLHGAQQHP